MRRGERARRAAAGRRRGGDPRVAVGARRVLAQRVQVVVRCGVDPGRSAAAMTGSSKKATPDLPRATSATTGSRLSVAATRWSSAAQESGLGNPASKAPCSGRRSRMASAARASVGPVPGPETAGSRPPPARAYGRRSRSRSGAAQNAAARRAVGRPAASRRRASSARRLKHAPAGCAPARSRVVLVAVARPGERQDLRELREQAVFTGTRAGSRPVSPRTAMQVGHDPLDLVGVDVVAEHRPFEALEGSRGSARREGGAARSAR